MIPDEDKGEPFEDALARVRQCIGGATGNDDADSDSDIEVVADFFGVNLRCPVSRFSRLQLVFDWLKQSNSFCLSLDYLMACMCTFLD